MNRHLAILFFLSWAPLSPLLYCAQHDQRTAAAAKTIPDTSADFDDVKPGDFAKQPATFELKPQVPGAPKGKVWVRKNARGLLIAGTITGRSPQFPTGEADLMGKEHIEIWLAVEPNPELPVLGWGDDVELPNEEQSCASVPDLDSIENCHAWVGEQKFYRAYFQRLFLRQWQISPSVTIESFAAPAFQTIKERLSADRDKFYYALTESLMPNGLPRTVFKTLFNGSYEFTVLVPWQSAWPVATGGTSLESW